MHARRLVLDPRSIRVAVALVLTVASSCTSPPLAGDRDARDVPVLIPPRTIDMEGRLVEPPARPAKGYIDFAQSPATDVVQLHLRPSFYARRIAYHPFFVAYDVEDDRWDKWEIWAFETTEWATTSRTTRRTYGDERVPTVAHEHQYGTIRHVENLVFLDDHTRAVIAGVWVDEEARRIIDVLERPTAYPWVETYRLWPGPNSNTYIAWVLEDAGLALDLPPRMVGKDWIGTFATGVATSHARTGLRASVLGLGATVGLREGVELNLLGATLGIDLWPPAVKTPLGRFGVAE